MRLKPVSFRYRSDPSALQYGLIAEQVAKVMPTLAVYGKDGLPETVKYQDLPVLLLNELQQQRQQNARLHARVDRSAWCWGAEARDMLRVGATGAPPCPSRLERVAAPRCCSAQRGTAQAASADPRQGIPGEHVDNAGAAEGGVEGDEAGGLGGDLGDDRGLAAEGMGAERG